MLGAAAGAFAAPWLLLPWGGIPGAVTVAAVGNLLAGLGALVLARGASATQARAGRAARARAAGRARAHPFGLWLSLYALSGFVALSLEILWFRLVDVAVKSTAFTFGTVLGIYLLGSAAGCLLAVPRVVAPAPAARHVPALPVRDPGPRGALRDRPHAAAARHARLRLARRVLGHLPLLPLRARERAGAGRAPVRGAAALPVRAAHAC